MQRLWPFKKKLLYKLKRIRVEGPIDQTNVGKALVNILLFSFDSNMFTEDELNQVTGQKHCVALFEVG